MGIIGLASYFFISSHFMYTITALALITTIFCIKKFKLSQYDLKIAFPIFSWITIFTFSNLILMLANSGFYTSRALNYLVLTILILCSCILLNILSKSRYNFYKVSINIFLIGFILST